MNVNENFALFVLKVIMKMTLICLLKIRIGIAYIALVTVFAQGV